MALTLVSSTVSLLLVLSSASLGNARSLLSKRDVVVPSNLPGDWAYKGCYTDQVGSRSLKGSNYGSGTDMTVEACISFCGTKGYSLAGTEYSQECYCGNALADASSVAAAADCNMGCSGNVTEACGGSNRLSVFQNNGASSGPVTNPGPGLWRSMGCYSDAVGGRTLVNGVGTTGGQAALTVALCTSACSDAGYILAGVEYASECYCGNVLANGGAPASDGCDMPCNGNSSEFCGGSNRLNVYNFNNTVENPTSGTASSSATSSTAASTATGWVSQGCYTDAVGSRTLNTPVYPAGAMTVELCLNACKANSFIYAGLEYAGECYCGNALLNGGAPASDGCNMACNGDATEMCGGANRLNLYKYGGGGGSATSSTATSASPTSSGSGSATGLPSGWDYKGCYVDGANGRIFAHQNADDAQMTIESCVQSCKSNGYSVAGMEYASQCFCDNFVRNGGDLASSDDQCGMACSGDAQEICGGPNRVSVYSNSTLQVYQPPAVQNTSLPGEWEYQGCISDAQDNRSLVYLSVLADNNTATNCLKLCQEFGYDAAGLEYGEECWCGDPVNIVASGATVELESDCNMACTGNASYNCGGQGGRMNWYKWTGTPLSSWDFRTSNSAGEYQFLIGGPVIPLISTPGVNGKVTFLEKYGTGPPNSTGAYELDVSQVPNGFNAAWREMHVKTDVFCAAGLTLPDKVGRQIDVGGWANDATYGIRLYWPDGSPGEPSTNDWQENVNELSLQAGRWYPTAMIMANGSILVVGGQEGANGAPVPSLEVLPKPAGGYVKFCDWLQRTDPYNLYPFLAVLPSGGIFVAYYNEARILDEITFDTIQTLPNIPGAVNNFLGGRTYPFEGTAMLLPQHAPYSDPLKVIICGGSTPGPEIAIDNCVTLAPDAPGDGWSIERMPSKRVITCMTALPDGTYLILNGAQQGRAGFGTSNTPNLNAVLYDPTAPQGTRMSVMANTTIARMYHSEAVLLQDGRVLVSGSDPQDSRYPQEYRVEVFVPPYLLAGNAQPTFTITDKDWTYGQSVSFTVTSGSTANLRVSLLGSVSSTHGNSMGQRTFFPTVSCSGNACTVTAPPNKYVCPPGWFQMFVLDGPTPSHSVWVRIGGDPAHLGNWPDYDDFQPLPGV